MRRVSCSPVFPARILGPRARQVRSHYSSTPCMQLHFLTLVRSLFLECPVQERCLGGNTTVATRGCEESTSGTTVRMSSSPQPQFSRKIGVACQHCRRDFYALFGSCNACNGGQFLNIILGLAICFAWILINFVIGARLDSFDTFLSACQYAVAQKITHTHTCKRAHAQDGIGAWFNQRQVAEQRANTI